MARAQGMYKFSRAYQQKQQVLQQAEQQQVLQQAEQQARIKERQSVSRGEALNQVESQLKSQPGVEGIERSSVGYWYGVDYKGERELKPLGYGYTSSGYKRSEVDPLYKVNVKESLAKFYAGDVSFFNAEKATKEDMQYMSDYRGDGSGDLERAASYQQRIEATAVEQAQAKQKSFAVSEIESVFKQSLEGTTNKYTKESLAYQQEKVRSAGYSPESIDAYNKEMDRWRKNEEAKGIQREYNYSIALQDAQKGLVQPSSIQGESTTARTAREYVGQLNKEVVSAKFSPQAVDKYNAEIERLNRNIAAKSTQAEWNVLQPYIGSTDKYYRQQGTTLKPVSLGEVQESLDKPFYAFKPQQAAAIESGKYKVDAAGGVTIYDPVSAQSKMPTYDPTKKGWQQDFVVLTKPGAPDAPVATYRMGQTGTTFGEFNTKMEQQNQMEQQNPMTKYTGRKDPKKYILNTQPQLKWVTEMGTYLSDRGMKGIEIFATPVEKRLERETPSNPNDIRNIVVIPQKAIVYGGRKISEGAVSVPQFFITGLPYYTEWTFRNPELFPAAAGTALYYGAKEFSKDPVGSSLSGYGFGLGMGGMSVALGKAARVGGKYTGLVKEQVYFPEQPTELGTPLTFSTGMRNIMGTIARYPGETTTVTRTQDSPSIFRFRAKPVSAETLEPGTTYGRPAMFVNLPKTDVLLASGFAQSSWKTGGLAAIPRTIKSTILRPRTYIIEKAQKVELPQQLHARMMSEIEETGGFKTTYKDIVDVAYEQSARTNKPVLVPSPKVAYYGLEYTGPLESEGVMIFGNKAATKIPSRSFGGFTTHGGGLITKVSYGEKSPVLFLTENLKENLKIKSSLKEMQFEDIRFNYGEQFGGMPSMREFEYSGHGPSHTLSVTERLFQLREKNPKTIGKFTDEQLLTAGKYHDLAKIGAMETGPFKHADIMGEAVIKGKIKTPEVWQLTASQLLEVSEAIRGHTAIKPGLRGVIQKLKGYKSTPLAKALATADRMDLTRFGVTPKKSMLFKFDSDSRTVGLPTIRKMTNIGSITGVGFPIKFPSADSLLKGKGGTKTSGTKYASQYDKYLYENEYKSLTKYGDYTQKYKYGYDSGKYGYTSGYKKYKQDYGNKYKPTNYEYGNKDYIKTGYITPPHYTKPYSYRYEKYKQDYGNKYYEKYKQDYGNKYYEKYKQDYGNKYTSTDYDYRNNEYIYGKYKYEYEKYKGYPFITPKKTKPIPSIDDIKRKPKTIKRKQKIGGFTWKITNPVPTFESVGFTPLKKTGKKSRKKIGGISL